MTGILHKVRCADCEKEFETKFARWCPDCRWKHRVRTKKYDWTPGRDAALRQRYDSRVRGRAAEIARAFGWPTWAIKKRARTLGLAHPRPEFNKWTPEEIEYLWNHAGERTAHWIAKKLGRSETSVVLKFKRLKISRRVSTGYTLRELELCFGVDHRVIERWVREGKLFAQRRITGRTDKQGDPWMVSDGDILQFISEHPLAFRLDRVEQTWFMDLILDGALIRKALEGAAA